MIFHVILIFSQIPVLANLPVGEHLKDHMYVDMPYTIEKPIAITPEESNSWSAAFTYQMFGTGKRKIISLISAYSF